MFFFLLICCTIDFTVYLTDSAEAPEGPSDSAHGTCEARRQTPESNLARHRERCKQEMHAGSSIKDHIITRWTRTR